MGSVHTSFSIQLFPFCNCLQFTEIGLVISYLWIMKRTEQNSKSKVFVLISIESQTMLHRELWFNQKQFDRPQRVLHHLLIEFLNPPPVQNPVKEGIHLVGHEMMRAGSMSTGCAPPDQHPGQHQRTWVTGHLTLKQIPYQQLLWRRETVRYPRLLLINMLLVMSKYTNLILFLYLLSTRLYIYAMLDMNALAVFVPGFRSPCKLTLFPLVCNQAIPEVNEPHLSDTSTTVCEILDTDCHASWELKMKRFLCRRDNCSTNE